MARNPKRTTGYKKAPIPEKDRQVLGVYRCDNCGQIFNTKADQTVGGIETNLEEDFGVTVEELMDRQIDLYVVCDPCYKKLQPEISGAL